MMRRLWVAAAAAAVAALYLLKLMFSCKRGPRSGKGKHYSQDPAHPAAERLLDEGSNEARDAARADGGAHSSVAAPASGAGTRGSEPVRVVAAIAGCETQSGTEQTLAGDEGAVDSEAVDITYLQSLLDKELGQPKFAVPKTAETSASPQGSPSAADAFTESAVGPERTSLHLTVTDGPAAGVTMQSANDQTEIVIGRLPVSTLSIVDQEVSGRHAVIRYDDQQDCWKVMDAGSLNGSILNGVTISNKDRKPGKQHVLGDQDILELGGLTKIKVNTSLPSPTHPAKRHASASAWAQAGSSPGCSSTPSKLPALQHVADYPSLSLRLAVHQKLGTDHQRNNTGMEDVVHHELPFEAFGQQSALLCIFDGHHGANAASQAKAILPGVLAEKLGAGSGAALVSGRPSERQRQLLTDVFLETDARLASDEGCTATVLMLERGAAGQLSVQAANVGDSAALLVNVTTGAWSRLTADHRIANSSAERQRLQERGHTVKKRLYGLNISRVLGDKFLKDEDLGFIAEPYVSQVEQLAPEHMGFIVVASDGLWDVLSEERAAGLVLKSWAESSAGTTAEAVADMMLTQALNLRSQDDISIMVLYKQ